MPAHRYYLPDFSSPLTDSELHHLKTVMRARPGDSLELVDGKGHLAHATITDSYHLSITHTITEPPPANTVILAQALTRPALLDWIIEKGTELGASHFHLFPGDYSEKDHLTPHQLDRLRTLLISALKQCGRLYLPTLTLHSPISRWTKPPGTLLYGSLAPTALPISNTYPSPITIVIGPEKGLSEKEQISLENLGGIGITLNKNILRAETAAVCALSLLCRT